VTAGRGRLLLEVIIHCHNQLLKPGANAQAGSYEAWGIGAVEIANATPPVITIIAIPWKLISLSQLDIYFF